MTDEGEQGTTSLEEMFGDGYEYSDEGQVVRKHVNDGQTYCDLEKEKQGQLKTGSSMPEYILKRPAKVVFDEEGRWARVYLNGNDDIFQEEVVTEYINDILVPLDRQALTEQIKQILVMTYVEGQDSKTVGKHRDSNLFFDSRIKMILELIGIDKTILDKLKNDGATVSFPVEGEQSD